MFIDKTKCTLITQVIDFYYVNEIWDGNSVPILVIYCDTHGFICDNQEWC